NHAAAKEFSALIDSQPNTNALSPRCQMMQIISHVFEKEIIKAQPRHRNRPTAKDRFAQMINEMPASELITRTHEDLAKLCGCSSRHFSRLFRDHFGLCLRKKQFELRVAKEHQLLPESNPHAFTSAGL